MKAIRQLSPRAKAEIKALSGARPGRFLATLATTWITIGLAVALACLARNMVVSALTIYLVATRQNILGLLIHDQTHQTGLNSRYGDLIVNCLAGYPLFVITVEGYARVHLAHHRHFFTRDDPDFLRKNGADWTFPMAPGRLAMLFLQDLTGLSVIRLLMRRHYDGEPGSTFKRKHPSPRGARILFLAALLTGLTLTGGWSLFLLYWVVPLVTVLPAIVRWGAICEHRYGEQGAALEDSTPVILPTRLSKLLLPNLNFTMHVYHHYFPAVSFANLPMVHAIFVREGLVRDDMIHRSQLDYLRHILSEKPQGAALAA